jgi:hypothetical protein
VPLSGTAPQKNHILYLVLSPNANDGPTVMTALAQKYRGVALLVELNLDRLIYPVAIIGGLALGSYLGTLALQGFQ